MKDKPRVGVPDSCPGQAAGTLRTQDEALAKTSHLGESVNELFGSACAGRFTRLIRGSRVAGKDPVCLFYDGDMSQFASR